MKESQQRPLLMYDGTLLANTFSRKNSDRTGVFFVVYNVFLQLVKQQYFELCLYSNCTSLRDVTRAVAGFGFSDLRIVSDQDIGQGLIPDVFLSPFAPPPTCVAENSRIAKYMILHDVTPLALPEIESPNKEWFNLLEKSLNHQDHYIANSEHTKKDFLRFYPVIDSQKIKVSYLGASQNFYRCNNKNTIATVKKKYGIPVDKKYVFSLCTIQPRKNLVHAVKCFVQFIKETKTKDLIFVIGGGHWDEFIKVLEGEVNELGHWKEYIIKTGYIDDEDLAPLYSGALFMVYVSLYEGFGLPVLEAMQCGCPVITSNISSLPEVIGDAGIMVDPKDPVELRAAYKRFYLDNKFREKCGIASLERAKRFSWKSFADDIISFVLDTWEETIKNQLISQKKKSSEDFSKTKSVHIKFFGKEWSPEKTVLRFLFLPLLSESRSKEKEVVRFLGIPLLVRYFNYYEIHTKLLGIPVKKRLNYQFIVSQIALYTESAANAICAFGKRLEESLPEDVLPEITVDQVMNKLDFFVLLEAVNNGSITLQEEMKAVDNLLHGIKGEKN